MPLAIRLEKRCLGQITRSQIRPEIKDGRGNCRKCNYYPSQNVQCTAYDPIVFRTFSVIRDFSEENANLEKAAKSYLRVFRRIFNYFLSK